MGRRGGMNDIALRPATSADGEWCYRLHRAALRTYVEAIWGWDEDTQRSMYRQSFDPARIRIVTVDGCDAGVLIVEHRAGVTYLGLIEIHPDHQGRGIGSRLIGRLLREAAERDRPVELDVLHVNRRAYALYQRLGFREVIRHGPGSIKIRMRATPEAVRPRPER